MIEGQSRVELVYYMEHDIHDAVRIHKGNTSIPSITQSFITFPDIVVWLTPHSRILTSRTPFHPRN